MNDHITVGAASLMGGLLGGTALVRWYVRPPRPKRERKPGRHRTAPGPLLRPVEALDRFEAHCPAEDRPTLHIRLRLGGELCTECRNPSPLALGLDASEVAS